VTTFLLTVAIVAAAMALLSVGVLVKGRFTGRVCRGGGLHKSDKKCAYCECDDSDEIG